MQVFFNKQPKIRGCWMLINHYWYWYGDFCCCIQQTCFDTDHHVNSKFVFFQSYRLQTILVEQGKEGNILRDKLSLMGQTRVERAKAKTKEIPSRTNKINTTLIRLDHHPYHFWSILTQIGLAECSPSPSPSAYSARFTSTTCSTLQNSVLELCVYSCQYLDSYP